LQLANDFGERHILNDNGAIGGHRLRTYRDVPKILNDREALEDLVGGMDNRASLTVAIRHC